MKFWPAALKKSYGNWKKSIQMHGHKNILYTVIFIVVNNQNHQIIPPESPTNLIAKKYFLGS